MSEQPTPDPSLYGRPYVDYYPYSGIPPRRGGYTVREPHGSEASTNKWESTATGKDGDGGDGSSQQQRSNAVKGGPVDNTSAGGGDEDREARREREISEKPAMETAANTVAAPREAESRVKNGPVCVPPKDS